MELPCLPAETPSTASSSATSTDPLYDNYCPPFAPPHHHHRGGQQRERAVVGVSSHSNLAAAATAAATGLLPAGATPPCNNHTALVAAGGGGAGAAGRAPTGPEVPVPCSSTWQGAGGGGPGEGGRGGAWGPGFWPDHSYCSWGGAGGGAGAGGLGTGVQSCWDAELRTNRARGGGVLREGRRLRGGERSAPCSPSPQSEEHQSALSVYDNLHDARGGATPDDLPDEEEDIAMETCSVQEDGDARQHHVAAGRVQQAMMTTAEEAEMDGGAASGGESSTWSSCEIILGGETADRTREEEEEVDPSEQKISEQKDSMEVPLRLSHHVPTATPPPPHPSQGAGLLQAQAGPSVPPSAPHHHHHHPQELPPVPRVPPPVPLADPSASALRIILTNLHQQIGRQREDYETRIYSLEQRNEELLMEVVGLRANLKQQKRWYQAVQAKIAESEEARAAAELHNAALQRELEQVFDTFGELNSEAMKTETIVRSF